MVISFVDLPPLVAFELGVAIVDKTNDESIADVIFVNFLFTIFPTFLILIICEYIKLLFIYCQDFKKIKTLWILFPQS